LPIYYKMDTEHNHKKSPKTNNRKGSPNNRKGSPNNRKDSPVNRKDSPVNRKDSPNNRKENPDDNLNELEKLYNFMKEYINKSGQNLPWTHTMVYEPYGSYDIPDDEYIKFRQLYEDAIVAGHKPYITEKHKEYGPIVIDLDFVQLKEHNKRYYTDNTIINIIKLYNRIIKKYLNIYNKNMDAYVCEKKEPTLRKGFYHDGLHIVYPYICTKPSLQMLIRKEFIELAEKNNIFKKIPLTNDLESVLDKNVIYNVGWMMYGSRKNTSSHAYYVTHIYSIANGKIFDTLLPSENIMTRSYIRHFIDVLSCRRFFNENDMTPFADNIDPADIDVEINKLKDKLVDGNNKKEEIAALMGEDINFIKVVSEDQYVEAKNLVKLFSNKRASDYYEWYQVGKCLFNIDYRLLSDWIEFSKKCPNKFKKGECEQLWKKMKPSNYTMATLHYFAQKDNPKKYLKMKEKKLNKLFKDGLEASHNTIAKILMEKYKFIYRCASIKHNIWYEFRNHRWIEIDSAYTLRNLISDELTIEYGKQQSYLYEFAKDKNGYEKEQIYAEATRINKVIKQLNNSSFKNGVIRECADIAYDPKFLKNLDENIYLICFENGIYDLEAKNFRDGCPDDCVSLCTNYKYTEYDKDDEYNKNINGFLKKIQPNKVMRKYLMTLLSTCLAGSISEESFYVFTGSGANGKSKLMELMKYTMGDLFKPMDIMVLIGKRTSSSSATPELADKKGIRICPFDEPKATDEINTGFMKIFTGGDEITARALYKEPTYFKPQFKPFLLCNHLPNIKSDDDGTWRRLKVIPFLSKFIRPSDITKSIKKNGLEKDQFWADSDLSEKLPEWKQIFMSKLIKYYKKYREFGLIHPKLVTKHTQDYRKKCDVFQDFISDYLMKTGDTKNSLNIMSLHEGMRSWYKANYEGKCPNTKELRNYMLHRMTSFNSKTDSLVGYKLKSSSGDGDVTLDELSSLHK
jgi:P4 family phage/plasmid primase-like protien